jgi:hypothetical protein
MIIKSKVLKVKELYNLLLSFYSLSQHSEDTLPGQTSTRLKTVLIALSDRFLFVKFSTNTFLLYFII